MRKIYYYIVDFIDAPSRGYTPIHDIAYNTPISWIFLERLFLQQLFVVDALMALIPLLLDFNYYIKQTFLGQYIPKIFRNILEIWFIGHWERQVLTAARASKRHMYAHGGNGRKNTYVRRIPILLPFPSSASRPVCGGYPAKRRNAYADQPRP